MLLLEQFPRLRSRWIAYGFALASVFVAAFAFWCSERVFSAPYLIPFVMAAAFSTLCGIGPGVIAWLFATALTDYLFVPPAGTLGLLSACSPIVLLIVIASRCR